MGLSQSINVAPIIIQTKIKGKQKMSLPTVRAGFYPMEGAADAIQNFDNKTDTDEGSGDERKLSATRVSKYAPPEQPKYLFELPPGGDPDVQDVKNEAISKYQGALMRRLQRRKIWKQDKGQMLTTKSSVQEAMEKSVFILAMIVLPDSQWIVVLGSDKRITFYEPATLKPKGQIRGLGGLGLSIQTVSSHKTAEKREAIIIGRDDGVIDIITLNEQLMRVVIDISTENGRKEMDKIIRTGQKTTDEEKEQEEAQQKEDQRKRRQRRMNQMRKELEQKELLRQALKQSKLINTQQSNKTVANESTIHSNNLVSVYIDNVDKNTTSINNNNIQQPPQLLYDNTQQIQQQGSHRQKQQIQLNIETDISPPITKTDSIGSPQLHYSQSQSQSASSSSSSQQQQQTFPQTPGTPPSPMSRSSSVVMLQNQLEYPPTPSFFGLTTDSEKQQPQYTQSQQQLQMFSLSTGTQQNKEQPQQRKKQLLPSVSTSLLTSHLITEFEKDRNRDKEREYMDIKEERRNQEEKEKQQSINHDLKQQLKEWYSLNSTGAKNPMWSVQAHDSLISQVLFIGQLNQVVSSSLDGTIRFWDFERLAYKGMFKKAGEDGVIFGHKRGIISMCWSERYKLIISGGIDYNVCIWDPFGQRHTGTLRGHTAPILSVTVDESAGLVLSLSGDQTIRVWDILSQLCVSKVSSFDNESKFFYKKLWYDKLSDYVILASKRLIGWKYTSPHAKNKDDQNKKEDESKAKVKLQQLIDGKMEVDKEKEKDTKDKKESKQEQKRKEEDKIKDKELSKKEQEEKLKKEKEEKEKKEQEQTFVIKDKEASGPNYNISSHMNDITFLVHNKVFNQLISIDLDNVINVWNMTTGRNAFRFKAFHNDSISCVTLDNSGRKIITGSLDGVIKIWNVNRGQLLKEYAQSKLDMNNNKNDQHDIMDDDNSMEKQQEKEIQEAKERKSRIKNQENQEERDHRLGKKEKGKEETSRGQNALYNILFCSTRYTPRLIIVVGAKKLIRAVDDTPGPMASERIIHSETSNKHGENVISCTFQEPNILVAVSDDGTMISWNAETGAEKMTLRRVVKKKPLQPNNNQQSFTSSYQQQQQLIKEKEKEKEQDESKDKENKENRSNSEDRDKIDKDDSNKDQEDKDEKISGLLSSTSQSSQSSLTKTNRQSIYPPSSKLFSQEDDDIKQVEQSQSNVITQCKFVPHATEQLLITYGQDGKIRFWTVAHAQQLIAVDTEKTSGIICVDQDGKQIALGASDGSVQVYHIDQILTHTVPIQKELGIEIKLEVDVNKESIPQALSKNKQPTPKSSNQNTLMPSILRSQSTTPVIQLNTPIPEIHFSQVIYSYFRAVKNEDIQCITFLPIEGLPAVKYLNLNKKLDRDNPLFNSKTKIDSIYSKEFSEGKYVYGSRRRQMLQQQQTENENKEQNKEQNEEGKEQKDQKDQKDQKEQKEQKGNTLKTSPRGRQSVIRNSNLTLNPNPDLIITEEQTEKEEEEYDKEPDPIEDVMLFLAVSFTRYIALFSTDGGLLGTYGAALSANQPPLYITLKREPKIIPIEERRIIPKITPALKAKILKEQQMQHTGIEARMRGGTLLPGMQNSITLPSAFRKKLQGNLLSQTQGSSGSQDESPDIDLERGDENEITFLTRQGQLQKQIQQQTMRQGSVSPFKQNMTIKSIEQQQQQQQQSLLQLDSTQGRLLGKEQTIKIGPAQNANEQGMNLNLNTTTTFAQTLYATKGTTAAQIIGAGNQDDGKQPASSTAITTSSPHTLRAQQQQTQFSKSPSNTLKSQRKAEHKLNAGDVDITGDQNDDIRNGISSLLKDTSDLQSDFNTSRTKRTSNL
ncbi:MAG: hypothetical protein EZS28_009966, partial [Streblomastix strix]